MGTLVHAWACTYSDTFDNSSLQNSILSLSKDQANADGNDRVLVSVTLLDGGNKPLQGATVHFTAPGATISQPTAGTDAAGYAQGTLVSNQSGPITVGAQVSLQGFKGPLTAQASLYFLQHAVTIHEAVTYGIELLMPGGAVNTAFVGPVAFSSSDTGATLPAMYTFTTVDGGQHIFLNGVTFSTSGIQTVTATDVATSTMLQQQIYYVTGSTGAAGIALTVADSSSVAGAAFPLTVTALNGQGIATSYVGTVLLGSSDSRLTPAFVSLDAVDQGEKTVNVQFFTAGEQNIIATDSGSGLQSTPLQVNVQAAAATSLVFVHTPTQATAGEGNSLLVVAHDLYGNVDENFADTVTLSSTDPNFLPPVAHTYNAGDAGQYTFAPGVTWMTAGPQTLNALDLDNNAVQSASFSVQVKASSAASLDVTAPSTTAAGEPSSFTVEAFDAYGNLATSFAGTVHFYSSDAQAFLPYTYTYVPTTDAGSHAFGALLRTAGDQNIVVIEPTLALQGNANMVITPVPGTACSLTFPSGSSGIAPYPTTGVLKVLDSFGNIASGYAGTMMFTSTDPNGQVPPNTTFTAANAGVYTFTNGFLFKTAGVQTITAQDTVQSGLATTANVLINPNVVSSLHLAFTPNLLNTQNGNIMLTAQDMCGNKVPSYNGVVTFASSDANAVLPPSATFAQGVATAPVTFARFGNQNVTAQDTSQPLSGTGTVNVLAAVVSMAPGGPQYGYHSCIVSANGLVKCWGYNHDGQLGIGNNFDIGNGTGQMGPALPVVNLGTGRTAVAVAVGGYGGPYGTSCALLDTGAVKCWGANPNGQLGLGDTLYRGGTAVSMGDALPTVNLGTNRTALQIALGAYTGCALLDNQNVKCWGYSSQGQLGLGNGAQTLGTSPSDMGDNLPYVNLGTGVKAKSISSGYSHVCVVTNSNNVKCWGSNGSGELGLGDASARGLAASDMGNNLPNVLLNGKTVSSVSTGTGFTCVLFTNGTTSCWGHNNEGELGVGDTLLRGTTVASMNANLPVLNFGGVNVTSISAGAWSTCAALANNTAMCWGTGTNGQLGTGNQNNVYSPPAPLALGTGRTVTTIVNRDYHACALLDNATVKCWGLGGPQLGLGDNTDRGGAANTMGDFLPAVPIW